MLMNRVETLLVTSPANRAFQRCVEAPMRLTVAFGLVAGFFGVELGFGLWSGSLALLSDAGHMAADVVALGAALPRPGSPPARTPAAFAPSAPTAPRYSPPVWRCC
ncbi:cation transporter [Nocardioides aequoreus]|uniref:cation transporter n=1 Tax=Nocardioides aequoreus TaxID=397278 RepID=UPI00316ACC4E